MERLKARRLLVGRAAPVSLIVEPQYACITLPEDKMSVSAGRQRDCWVEVSDGTAGETARTPETANDAETASGTRCLSQQRADGACTPGLT